VFWFIISFVLVLISVFPSVIVAISDALGFASPANFVFLCIIFILLIMVFTLSLKVSQLESKLQTFVQTYAIQQHENNTKNEKTD